MSINVEMVMAAYIVVPALVSDRNGSSVRLMQMVGNMNNAQIHNKFGLDYNS